MSEREMGDTTEKRRGSLLAGPYWEDPVYRYLSRGHRLAVAAGDDTEAVRFDGLMQELVNRSMSDERCRQLQLEAKADRKRQRQERKRRRKPSTHASAVERPASVNVANLKKRIFVDADARPVPRG